MATFTGFKDIEAWQKARLLAQEVYAISAQGAFARDFGLRDQMRRAATSVMSNIAEGFERDGAGEFVQFLSVAKGSIGEVQSCLYAALDQRYLTQESFDRLWLLSVEVARMIGGLMNYLRRSGVRGGKFKVLTRNKGAAHVRLSQDPNEKPETRNQKLEH